MTAEKKEIKEINLTEFSTMDHLDLSGGFTCDVETGLCGPVEEKAIEKQEESTHENNNMV